MKFITEEDLRDLYKKQPFTDYNLQEGESLTPGARQFLVDRGIDMYDRSNPLSESETPGSGNKTKPCKPSEDKKKKAFESKFKSLQALFLLTAKDVMAEDICMSQQLTGLYRQFASLKAVSDGKCEAASLCCNACSGINGENFSQCIGDCFDITEFHMQMEKGKQMLLMARLRSELEVFDAETSVFIDDMKLQQAVSANLNQIINTLSQMICAAMGGNECQRKI